MAFVSIANSVFTARDLDSQGVAVCGATVGQPRRSQGAATAARSVRMAWDMNGSGPGTLGPRMIKSSAINDDCRCFKISYVLPSESRAYSARELQQVATTKLVPFSSWYSEQQRIMKMGGKITSVELMSGAPQRNVGNS